jgi:hypothetical protein
MSTTTDKQFGPWLKWAWRYGHLGVDDFATLDDALGAAWAAREAGDEVLEEIEGPDEIVADDIVEADYARRVKADDDAESAQPVATHRVTLRSPNGKHDVAVSWHTSEADADTVASRLREFYRDRVSVKRQR